VFRTFAKPLASTALSHAGCKGPTPTQCTPLSLPQDPWFISHLPPGAHTMNSRALESDASPDAAAARAASEARIRSIVAAAVAGPGPQGCSWDGFSPEGQPHGLGASVGPSEGQVGA
jgi:hypothetical protein